MIAQADPLISAFQKELTFPHEFPAGTEMSDGDLSGRGGILATKDLDDLARLTVRTAFPSINRTLDLSESTTGRSFVGGNLRAANYKHDAEDRLRENAAQATFIHGAITRMAKTDVSVARSYLTENPQSAAYALLRNDFTLLCRELDRIADSKREAQDGDLSDHDKSQRLRILHQTRRLVLNRADLLDQALFSTKRLR